MVDDKYVVKSLQTPCVYFDPDFLAADEATCFYDDLLKNIKWEKTAKINRWVSLHHSKDLSDYQYRDAPGEAHVGFTESIRAIQEKAQEWYFQQTDRRVEFNVCLLNYYENGQQRIGWHSDREEKGRTTPIASVSLGTPRQFHIRNKTSGPQDRAAFDMPNGSMVIMENVCQDLYLHSVPRQSSIETGRINLTFRCKEFTTLGEEEHARRDEGLKNITDGATPSATPWSNPSNEDTASDINIFGHNVRTGGMYPNFPTIYFVIKTNLGTERFCGAEIEELLSNVEHLRDTWRVVACPLGMDGFVACCCSSIDGTMAPDIIAETTNLLLGLRSAHHVIEYHTDFDIRECCNDDFPTPASVDGERLYSYFKDQLTRNDEKRVVISSLEKLAISGGGTFRASCDRIGGPHAFQRPHVEREMGGALAEYYEPHNIRPKMEDYDVCVRVDVVGYRVIVGKFLCVPSPIHHHTAHHLMTLSNPFYPWSYSGTQLNVSDLSKDRHFLKFRNAVTVKTNIAYALVRLANAQPGHTILDPFCGSGTLLLEALEVLQKQAFCIGMDVSRRSANGARDNAQAENYGDDVCNFVCSDARGLRRHVQDNSVDAIISNLPWGVQTGQKHSVSDLSTLYEVFLRSAWYVLKKNSRMVLLVLRGLQLTRIIRKLSGRYRLLCVHVIRTANNLPSILVVEKLERDEVRENIKGQLAYMNQYVNVSPEMYQSLHVEAIDE